MCRLREAGRRHRYPRGCADRAEGWRACARLNDTETLAPHGHDCSLFFYCRSPGARPACRKCPAGLHFNPQLQVCDWPDNVECNPRPPRPSRPPRPQPNGTTVYPASPEEGTIDYTVSDPPATDAPATDTPDTNAPASDTPASDTPASDTPATNAPASDTPASDTPATNAPASDTPATDAPIDWWF